MIQWDKLDPAAWANAVLILIGGLLAHFGIGQVRKAREKSPPQGDVLEVAGAIVSDKSVSRMVASLDEFSAAATVLKAAIDRDVAAKTAMTEALTANSRALERNSTTADDMLDGIKDAARNMERLKDELIRGQGH